MAIANSRGPETLADLVESIRATDAAGAAEFGDVVVETVPYPGRDGEIDFGGGSTSTWVAEQLGDPAVVKAFNTIYAERLANDDRADLPVEDRLVIPIAGDDEPSKATVAGLVEEIGFGSDPTRRPRAQRTR